MIGGSNEEKLTRARRKELRGAISEQIRLQKEIQKRREQIGREESFQSRTTNISPGDIFRSRAKVKVLELEIDEIQKLKDEADRRSGAAFTKLSGSNRIREFNDELAKSSELTDRLNSRLKSGSGTRDSDSIVKSLQAMEVLRLRNIKHLEETKRLDSRNVKISENARQVQEDINNILEKRTDLLNRIEGKTKEIFASFVDADDNVVETIGAAQLNVERARSGAPSETNQLAQLRRRQEEVRASIRREAESVEKLNTTSNSDLSNAQNRARVEEQRKRVAELIRKDAELSVDIRAEALNIEAEILRAQQDQTAEVGKQLGLLSDADRLRVLSTAQFFQENENARFDQNDLFLAGADSNRILREFFSSRLDNPGDVPDILRGSGFGPQGRGDTSSQDILRAAQIIADSGRLTSETNATLAELLREQRDAIERAAEVEGDGALVPGSQPIGIDPSQLVINPEIDTSVFTNEIAGSFQAAFARLIGELSERIDQRLQEIVDSGIELERTNPAPQVQNN